MISFYKIYTLYQVGAVHNEVNWGNIHRHGNIYVIDFMSRMYIILADICNIKQGFRFWGARSLSRA